MRAIPLEMDQILGEMLAELKFYDEICNHVEKTVSWGSFLHSRGNGLSSVSGIHSAMIS